MSLTIPIWLLWGLGALGLVFCIPLALFGAYWLLKLLHWRGPFG